MTRRSMTALRLGLVLAGSTILAACSSDGSDASNDLADLLGIPTERALNTTNANLVNTNPGQVDAPQVDSNRVTVTLLDDNAFRIQGPNGFDETFEEDDRVTLPSSVIDPRILVFQNDNNKIAFLLNPQSGDPSNPFSPEYEYAALGGWIDGLLPEYDPTNPAATLPDNGVVTQAGSIVLGRAFPGSLPTSGNAYFLGDSGGLLRNGSGELFMLTGGSNVAVAWGTGDVTVGLNMVSTSLLTGAPGTSLNLQGTGSVNGSSFTGSWNPGSSGGYEGALAGSFFGEANSFTNENAEVGGAWNATGPSNEAAVGGFIGKQTLP